MDIEPADVRTKQLKISIQNDKWWIGVLLPQILALPNGSECRQCLVSNLTTGELERVWEDDLMPFSWISHLKPRDKVEIVKNHKKDERLAFADSWRFAKKMSSGARNRRKEENNLVTKMKIAKYEVQ
uniref:Uncharacterized protein n=1 Tax=Caenorhabditis japonica TaxID=281687 RepID=A0A8R1I4A2_CAEJA